MRLILERECTQKCAKEREAQTVAFRAADVDSESQTVQADARHSGVSQGKEKTEASVLFASVETAPSAEAHLD